MLEDLLISAEEVSRLTGYTVATLAQRRHKGQGPEFVRLNRRVVRYRVKDVIDFISQRFQNGKSSSQYPLVAT